MTTNLKPSDILRRAAALIEERGLPEGVTGSRGEMCAAATIGWVEAEHGFGLGKDAGSLDMLRRVVGNDVAGWSDAAARAGTPSTVIDGLRRAAELAESEGG